MKKYLSLILSLVILSSMCMQTVGFAENIEVSDTETNITEYVAGDINNNNILNITDVALLRAYIVGTKVFDDNEFLRADMNSDGKANIVDVAIMRKIIVGGNIEDTDTETDTATDTESDTNTESDTDTEITQTITKTYQVWVIDDDTKLRIRSYHSLSATQTGWMYGGETVKIYETVSQDGYLWGKIYKIDDDKTFDGHWCALDYATNIGTVKETETIVIQKPDPNVDPNKIIDTLPAVKAESESTTFIRIKENYTSVYNANHKSEFYAPVYSQLPEGTVEYLLKNDGKYYISTDGRKYLISAGTTEVISGKGLGTNNLQVKSITEENGATILKIKTDDKSAFNIQPYSVTYTRLDDTDHFYTINSFNPTEIRITFDNITGITSLPEFNGSDLFSTVKWTKVTDSGRTKFCLVLTLRQSGIYNGSHATYDENGNLIIKFTRYHNLIKGSVIVLDPGHGLNNSGAIGYLNGKAIYESTVNYQIAKKLEAKLKAAGATVYVLPTDTQVIDHKERAHLARQYNPDVFISIHANSSTYSSPRGSQAYYYNPASYPLARSVVERVENALGYSNLSDNCLESEYSVTTQNDFASILLETGFMSNVNDLAIISNPTRQEDIAKAILTGISEFFGRKKS